MKKITDRMRKIMTIVLKRVLKTSHISSSFFSTRKSVKTGIKTAERIPATRRWEMVNGMYVAIFMASETKVVPKKYAMVSSLTKPRILLRSVIVIIMKLIETSFLPLKNYFLQIEK